MTLQGRLENKLRQQRELAEVVQQAEVNVTMAVASREYSFVERNAAIIVKAENELSLLNAEIQSLRESIIEEAKEDLL